MTAARINPTRKNQWSTLHLTQTRSSSSQGNSSVGVVRRPRCHPDSTDSKCDEFRNRIGVDIDEPPLHSRDGHASQ